MALQFSSSSKNSRQSNNPLFSDINVTPLVDVMLVLLIIFMITSPMMVAGINVDLPETKSSPISGQDEPLVISIDKKGDVYLHDTKIDRNEIAAKLSAITKEKKDVRIFVRGDKKASYGDIVSIVSEITAAGFTKVALISNIKQNEKR